MPPNTRSGLIDGTSNVIPESGGTGYTVFGTVTKGLDIVTQVAAAGTATAGGDGAPKKKVTIESVTIGKT